MSIASFFKSLAHTTVPVTVPKVLTAAETVVSDLLPVVGDDLAAFSATLPAAHDSIFAVATKAQALVKDAKGHDLSFSLALHLAQAVITAHWPQIVAEAEALVAKL